MSEFSLRPARPEDAEVVAALSARIWEGEDYVPRRFAEWTSDRHGQFTLAWEGERLVGFGKLTRLRRGQWWLEGLRVHPEQRGRGIARLLHNHAVQLADEIGQGTLRFATADENVAVHKLAADSGFGVVGRFCRAEAPARAADDAGAAQECRSRLAPLTGAEVDAARAWLPGSPGFEAWGGLYEERWKWLELLPELGDLQRQERLFWWDDNARQDKGLVVAQAEHEEDLWVNYLGGSTQLLPAMALDLRALAARLGRDRVRIKAPSTPGFRQALCESGWEIEEEFEMCIFERLLGQ